MTTTFHAITKSGCTAMSLYI